MKNPKEKNTSENFQVKHFQYNLQVRNNMIAYKNMEQFSELCVKKFQLQNIIKVYIQMPLSL